MLAPYLAVELKGLLSSELATEGLSADYDERTCAVFVRELGERVVDRAIVLFEAIAQDGRINSAELAELLDARPPQLGALLTTPIKRRAKTLGLPWPFEGGQGDRDYGGIASPQPGDDPGRTYWEDRDGIAERMLQALRERQTPTSTGSSRKAS
jgi:hypothetical protein